MRAAENCNEGIRCAGRAAGRREAARRQRATAVCMQRAGEGPTADWGGARGQERTSNMDCMFVTPDVSKLRGWLNADACCRELQ
mgnify:CR=1 FL=1